MSSLSDIKNWTSNDMDSTAAHFEALADQREGTMASIKAVDTGVWTGQGGEGKNAAIAKHSATANTHAEMFRAIAQVAKIGGKDIYGAQQQVINTVAQAENSGFKVSDSFAVTDNLYPSGSTPWAARQGIAATYQSVLTTQAAAFDGHRAATASGIQAVDFKTGGGDGAESPMPDIGDEHLGGGGGRTPLEDGLGGPAGPPNDWWKYNPQDVQHCPPKDLITDIDRTATSVLGEAGLIAATPGEGPLAIVGGAAIIGNLANIGDNVDRLEQCLDEGIG